MRQLILLSKGLAVRYKQLLISFVFVISTNAVATTLKDMQPHEFPTQPWAEQWLYYINDPNVGYFKIGLHTYELVGEQNDSDTSKNLYKGFIHVVYTALDGKTEIFDYYLDEVYAASDQAFYDYGFRFEAPGVVTANENNIDLNLPDVKVSANWTDDYTHYWSDYNPGRSPFLFLADFPNVKNRWFIFSMGNPSNYTYSSDQYKFNGIGTIYIDKTWYTDYSSGFTYVLGTEEKQKIMAVTGSDSGIPLEFWTARYISENQDVTYLPTLKGLGVKRIIDACAGSLHLEIKGLGKKLIVNAHAAPSDFYDSEFPGVVIFNASDAPMKTMNAKIEVQVFKHNKLVETSYFNQGLLEFSGDKGCQ